MLQGQRLPVPPHAQLLPQAQLCKGSSCLAHQLGAVDHKQHASPAAHHPARQLARHPGLAAPSGQVQQGTAWQGRGGEGGLLQGRGTASSSGRVNGSGLRAAAVQGGAGAGPGAGWRCLQAQVQLLHLTHYAALVGAQRLEQARGDQGGRAQRQRGGQRGWGWGGQLAGWGLLGRCGG